MRRRVGRIGPDGSSVPFLNGRPVDRRPVGPLGRSVGVGNPYEDDYFWTGYRDPGPGEERPLDVVIDPSCDPSRPLSPETKERMAALKCTLNDVLARQVVFTKFPANVQPPWFAQPIMKSKVVTIAAGETVPIFDRMIPERMRAVITTLGIDVDPITSILDRTCEFWFDQGSQDKIIQVFDDQTETAYEETDGVDAGKTTVLPGGLTVPFNFLQAGMQFHVKGPSMLRFMMENKGDADVTIRGVMGYYQYWMPYGATEFETGDVQM